MSAPITADERAAMRGRADGLRALALNALATPTEHAYSAHVPRLLDALDTAEAEVARLREEAAPVRPDRETIARALRDAGLVEVVAVHEGYGAEEVVHSHLRPLADAVLALWPGESRATVQAEALRDWISEWPTTPGDGTFLADVARDGLARADRIAAEGGTTP